MAAWLLCCLHPSPGLCGREAVDGGAVGWQYVGDGTVADSGVAILEEYASNTCVAAVGCQGYVATWEGTRAVNRIYANTTVLM